MPNGKVIIYIEYFMCENYLLAILNIEISVLLEMQAATPAPVQNETADDDDDDEPLNEDDDEDLDDVDQGDDLSSTHLVLAQFDKVLMNFYTFC